MKRRASSPLRMRQASNRRAPNRLGGNRAGRSCTPLEEAAVISAFRQGIAITAIARRSGKPPGAIAWMLKKAGLKKNIHKRPSADEGGDAAPEDQPISFRRQDLAFQQAMRRAVALGKENPPMIGVYKDARPLDAPRLFEPVPHSSGCTSPARECADLASPFD
jgi:hypothetical protein